MKQIAIYIRSHKYQVVAFVFCICFGIALILNVEQAGDSAWYWYAELLLRGKTLYTTLKVPFQPLMVLQTELFLVLLGKSWLASKVPALIYLLLYVSGMYFILARSKWRDWEKGVILLGGFFLSIGFEDFRFDDYHVLGSVFILYSLLLLLQLPSQITPRSLYIRTSFLGALIGLLFTTEMPYGLLLFGVAFFGILILARNSRYRSSAIFAGSAIITVLTVVHATGDSVGAWSSSTIFHASSIKGGRFELLLDPFKMVITAFNYVLTIGLYQAVLLLGLAVGAAVLSWSLTTHWRSGVKPGVVRWNHDNDGIIFLASSGFLTALIIAITLVRDLLHHTSAISSLMPQWFTLGLLGLGMIAFNSHLLKQMATLAQLRNWIMRALWFFAAVDVITAIVLLVVNDTFYAFVIVAFTVLIIYNLYQDPRHNLASLLVLIAAVLGIWAYTLGLPFTPLPSELLAATPSTALALIKFLGATLLVWIAFSQLADPAKRRPIFRQSIEYATATLFFLWQGFRIDGLTSDWVPYHRSYWTGPATFIRDGHWLLWDIPSQYGFLSELIIAKFPGATCDQSLYLVSAIALAAQALMLFAILRSYGKGIVNFIFAFTVSAAAFFSLDAGRYPFGGRLYPQIGLRFIWVEALLFIAYLIYRHPAWRTALHRLGFIVWAIGIMWSFESAAWVTVVWGGYILADIFLHDHLRSANWLATVRLRLWPFLAIPAAVILCLDTYYFIYLGHLPDWLSYVEFSALYLSNPAFRQPLNLVGPGWLLILAFGALLALWFVVYKNGRPKAAPLLATAWMTLWATSIYYFGEAFDNHVNALAGILGFIAAVVGGIYTRENLSRSAAGRLSLFSFAPFLIILLTFSFGNVTWNMLLPPYIKNVVRAMPPINGPLLRIIDAAGIKPSDKVILPQSITWTTLSAGVILPYLRVQGRNRALVAWLPVSPNGPYNMWFTLSPSRRQTYIDRFVKIEKRGGWIITPHSESATCNLFSSHKYFSPERTVSTNSYNATLCKFGN